MPLSEAVSYAEIYAWAAAEDCVFRLGLVRDYCSPGPPTVGRSGAYVVDGLLAAEFTDAHSNRVVKVPGRYFEEIQDSA